MMAPDWFEKRKKFLLSRFRRVATRGLSKPLLNEGFERHAAFGWRKRVDDVTWIVDTERTTETIRREVHFKIHVGVFLHGFTDAYPDWPKEEPRRSWDSPLNLGLSLDMPVGYSYNWQFTEKATDEELDEMADGIKARIESHALPFFANFRTCRDVADAYRQFAEDVEAKRYQGLAYGAGRLYEFAAVSYFLAGDTAAQAECFDRAVVAWSRRKIGEDFDKEIADLRAHISTLDREAILAEA
jgi:hypothetical protein